MRQALFFALVSTIGFEALPELSIADTISACANKRTGIMRLADRCKKREIPFSINQIGPVGPAGPQGVPGAAGNIRVYDNNDQFLGYLMSEFGNIYIPSLKAIASIDINNSDGNGPYGEIVQTDLESSAHYGSPDCVGARYFWPKSGELDRIIKKKGKYYSARSRPPVRLLPMSHQYLDLENDGVAQVVCDNTPWDKEIWVVPGFDYTEVTLPFSTPVAFPLRLE